MSRHGDRAFVLICLSFLFDGDGREREEREKKTHNSEKIEFNILYCAYSFLIGIELFTHCESHKT